MRITNPDELLSRVERALLPVSAARAALLFGSRLTGHARSGSDVDIAVLLDAASATALRKPLMWALFAAIGLCDEHDLSVIDRHLQPLLRRPAGLATTVDLLAAQVAAEGFDALFPVTPSDRRAATASAPPTV